MMKDLIPYDESAMFDVISNTNKINPFAKAIGDFTSGLSKPIIEIKKIKALETIAIIKGRQDAEVRKNVVETLRQALISGNLTSEAQVEAIRVLEKINYK